MSCTVTGNVKNLGLGVEASNVIIRFWLRGTGGNQPRVNGTALIAPTQGGTFYFDFVPNSAGLISGTLYSTRDAAGTGNGEIEVGGSFTATWYGMQAFLNGRSGPEVPVHAKNTGSIDISNVTPITTNPVVTSPTGDTTYGRLDGGNHPFTSVQSAFYKTNAANPATSGAYRLGTSDTIKIRDNANTADLNVFSKDSTDKFTIGLDSLRGFVILNAGAAGIGGNTSLGAGAGTTSSGGEIIVGGGAAGSGAAPGGNAKLQGGSGGATSGVGGNAYLLGGQATGGNSNGGDVVLQPGAKSGSGVVGNIKLLDSSGAVQMGVTVKNGSGAGNYTTTSAAYADVDGTNLSFTTVVPVGWKAIIDLVAFGNSSTANSMAVAIADGTTALREVNSYGPAGGNISIVLKHVFTGDGASHTFKIRFLVSAGTGTIANASAVASPIFTVTLMPSN